MDNNPQELWSRHWYDYLTQFRLFAGNVDKKAAAEQAQAIGSTIRLLLYLEYCAIKKEEENVRVALENVHKPW